MKPWNSDIVKMIMRVERHLCPSYCGVVERRRVIAFLFLSLIEMLVIPFHLSMFVTLGEPWGLSVSIAHALAFVGGAISYMGAKDFF